MKNQNNGKTCENCRFYLGHYIKRNISYFNIHSGHCTNGNHKKHTKKEESEVCGFWEDIAIKKEERKKSIKQTLEFMAQQINEIAALLKDDAE